MSVLNKNRVNGDFVQSGNTVANRSLFLRRRRSVCARGGKGADEVSIMGKTSNK